MLREILRFPLPRLEEGQGGVTDGLGMPVMGEVGGQRHTC